MSNVVYYIGAEGDGHVKIGTTKNLPARIRALSTARADGNQLKVLATEPGTYDLEQKRHAQFAESRAHGEWFQLTPELQQHIEDLAVRSDPIYVRGYNEGYAAALNDRDSARRFACEACGDEPDMLFRDDWIGGATVGLCLRCVKSESSIEGYQQGFARGAELTAQEGAQA